MKVEMGKKYRTRGGNKVTVLSTSLNSDRPVAAVVHKNIDILFAFLKDGKVLSGVDSADDLIEVGPYEDFKIDDKVLVWENGKQLKKRRHFAGIDEGTGKPMAWIDGLTSWTSNTPSSTWDHCEKADEI